MWIDKSVGKTINYQRPKREVMFAMTRNLICCNSSKRSPLYTDWVQNGLELQSRPALLVHNDVKLRLIPRTRPSRFTSFFVTVQSHLFLLSPDIWPSNCHGPIALRCVRTGMFMNYLLLFIILIVIRKRKSQSATFPFKFGEPNVTEIL